MTSHHPIDVGMRYCGHCHAWIGEERCDFCDGEYRAVKHYKAKIQFVGALDDGRVMTDKDGLWSACVECAALIDARRWDDLEDRCYVGHLGRWELLGLALSRPAWDTAVRPMWTNVFGEEFSLKEKPHGPDDHGSSCGN